MIESETTAAFTNTDLRRARFWIQRWRQIGGGFVVTPVGDNLCTVDAVRTAHDDPKLEKHYLKAAPELLMELEKDRKKSDVVMTLAIDAHQRSMAMVEQTIANDAEQEPQGDPPAAA